MSAETADAILKLAQAVERLAESQRAGTRDIAEAIRESFTSEHDDANMVRTTAAIARRLGDLGNADAATPMGAIEGMSVTLRDAIKEGFGDLADAVREGLER